MNLAALETLEAEAANRGFRVRFEKVTVCTLPVESEPGCTTLDEARQLLERVQKVASAGGIRNAHIVSPDGSVGGAVLVGAPPPPPAPTLDTRPSEPLGAPGPRVPLHLTPTEASGIRAALERIHSLPREPSERLRALQADAEDADEMGVPV